MNVIIIPLLLIFLYFVYLISIFYEDISKIINRNKGMKEYLVFVGNVYYPDSGMGDFKKDFDNKDEAISYAKEQLAIIEPDEQRRKKFNYAKVYSCSKGKNIFDI